MDVMDRFPSVFPSDITDGGSWLHRSICRFVRRSFALTTWPRHPLLTVCVGAGQYTYMCVCVLGWGGGGERGVRRSSMFTI